MKTIREYILLLGMAVVGWIAFYGVMRLFCWLALVGRAL